MNTDFQGVGFKKAFVVPRGLTDVLLHGMISAMFVRLKSSPNSPRRSVQIVETKRVNGKPRQRVIRQLGTASEPDEIEALKNLGEFIIAKMKEQAAPTLFGPELMAQIATASREQKPETPALPVDLKQLREEHRVILGIHDIYGRVYDELGFFGSIEFPSETFIEGSSGYCSGPYSQSEEQEGFGGGA